jgi:hypothetical protein
MTANAEQDSNTMNGWLAPGLLALLVPLCAMIVWSVHRFLRRGASAAVRDWLTYVGVGMVIVLGILLAVHKDVDPDVLMRWFTPIATASFALGFPVRHYWPYVRHPKLWGTLSALLIAHFVFFFLVLSSSWRGNPLLIFIVGIPEMYIAYTALILVFKRPPSRMQ